LKNGVVEEHFANGALSSVGEYMRIPGHADHRFRRMPIANSGACRSSIPAHADH